MLKLSAIIISIAIFSFNNGYCDTIPKIEYSSKTNSIVFTQYGYTTVIQKSIFSKEENILLIQKLWNHDPDYIESNRRNYSKLSVNTTIVGISSFIIYDLDKFYPDKNPIDNMILNGNTDFFLVNDNSGYLDVFACLNLPSKDIFSLNTLNFLGEKGLSKWSYTLSLELILKLLSTSDWDLSQLRIIMLEGYDELFVLYQGTIYAAVQKGFLTFVEYFDDVDKNNIKDLKNFRNMFAWEGFRG